MSIEDDLTRIADGIDKLVVILGSDSVKSPIDALAEERLEAAAKVRDEVLAKEIPATPAPQSVEIEEVTVEEVKPKPKPVEIIIGDYVKVNSGDDKQGLEGTVTGGSKSWLQLTVEIGNKDYPAGTVVPVRKSTLVNVLSDSQEETPSWVEAAKAVEGVELTEEVVADPTPEVVIPAGEDSIPSDDLDAPENFVLPGKGKHSKKTLNTIFNEGERAILFLKFLAKNDLMGVKHPEVTPTVRVFLDSKDIIWDAV